MPNHNLATQQKSNLATRKTSKFDHKPPHSDGELSEMEAAAATQSEQTTIPLTKKISKNFNVRKLKIW